MYFAWAGGEVEAQGLTNPTQVSSWLNHSCAISQVADERGVTCWGSNTFVPELANPAWVSAGYNSSCAIDDTGVVCWGNTTVETTPSLSAPTLVDTGEAYACAVDEGNVKCWDRGSSSISVTRPVEEVFGCLKWAMDSRVFLMKQGCLVSLFRTWWCNRHYLCAE